jgi:hypothetical protein
MSEHFLHKIMDLYKSLCLHILLMGSKTKRLSHFYIVKSNLLGLFIQCNSEGTHTLSKAVHAQKLKKIAT